MTRNDETLTFDEIEIINLLKGKNRMEIDEILGGIENDTLQPD